MKHPADETPTPAMPWTLWILMILAGFGADALARAWFGDDAAIVGWMLAAAAVVMAAGRYLIRRLS
jgi:hypothetical protein